MSFDERPDIKQLVYNLVLLFFELQALLVHLLGQLIQVPLCAVARGMIFGMLAVVERLDLKKQCVEFLFPTLTLLLELCEERLVNRVDNC